MPHSINPKRLKGVQGEPRKKLTAAELKQRRHKRRNPKVRRDHTEAELLALRTKQAAFKAKEHAKAVAASRR